ncbi:MAG: hypothetical protein IPN58_07090 [Anaerolineales bacterium]|nr:hypothetical protein [Anaerolineales bacterium]
MGSTHFDFGYGIVVDSIGNVYTTGLFQDTVDFDPGAGVTDLVSIGFQDTFISKLDSNGDYVWAKSMGGINLDSGVDIALDSYGNVYTMGVFMDTVDFDPGAGTTNLISAGNKDTFLSKLDSHGDYIWAKSIGGTDLDYGTSIALDVSGNIHMAGYFYGTADFDPGAGIANLISGEVISSFPNLRMIPSHRL